MPRKVFIRKDVLNELRHSLFSPENISGKERFGALFGQKDLYKYVVTNFAEVTTLVSTDEYHEPDPRDLEMKVRSRPAGSELIGYYHTHPSWWGTHLTRRDRENYKNLGKIYDGFLMGILTETETKCYEVVLNQRFLECEWQEW